ncbi:MAG: FAD-dependent oxidoreductase [Pseudomonadota bacterium]
MSETARSGVDSEVGWLLDRDQLSISPTRASRIERAQSELFDLAVIGGGIHGVSIAKMAARAGLSVLLLERADYASGTSSRSSKMAHGGLRYLEMFDFKQVFEGIKAREELFERLPNLVTPYKFLIPVKRGDRWFGFKLGVGLKLYDLMARNSQHRHRWIPRAELSFTGFNSNRADLDGCYQYVDGIMNDARIVFDILVSAQSYGCCALNYALVERLEREGDGSVRISWRDLTRDSGALCSRARLVINCAGPWAPLLQAGSPGVPQARYSRGSHLLFSVPWRDPALFLPLAEKGRYYFVWPHATGTMVGTTEREVDSLELDPLPAVDEIQEILTRLKRDLPSSNLDRSTMHYAFAGVRTLPLRSSSKGGAGKGVSQLSRKHRWGFVDGVLTLVGGKWTTFAWTAEEGLRLALEKLGRGDVNVPGALDDLPAGLSRVGAERLSAHIAERFGVSVEAANRVTKRLGRSVTRYFNRKEAWRELPGGLLALELLHAVELEQALGVEDVIRRRLDLEFTPSRGVELAGEVSAVLAGRCDASWLAHSERAWREHLAEVGRRCNPEL